MIIKTEVKDASACLRSMGSSSIILDIRTKENIFLELEIERDDASELFEDLKSVLRK